MTTVATASGGAPEIVVSEVGAKGLTGDAGEDGTGFNSVQYGLINNPLFHLYKTNDLVKVSAPTNTDVDLTVVRNGVANGIDQYGGVFEKLDNEARLEKDGARFDVSSTNLFLNSRAPVTQSVTLSAGDWTISVYGTGDITTSYGTATTGNDLTFTSTGEVLLCTVNGSPDAIQIENLSFSTRPIDTVGLPVIRPKEYHSLVGYNNQPNPQESWWCAFGVSDLNSKNFPIFISGDLGVAPDDFTIFSTSDRKLSMNYGTMGLFGASGDLDGDNQACVTFNAATNTLSTYINGVFQRSTNTGLPPTKIQNTLYIGASSTLQAALTANIKDFRMGQGLLNEDTIKYLAQ